MATLVYKMTHKGDPDHARGFWGVEDCMGRIRDYDFDAVIGIGGLTWWKRETSRAGEVVWIGIEPQKVPVQGKRGPLVRFAHFHYFLEGELMLSEIAPVLEKSMHCAVSCATGSVRLRNGKSNESANWHCRLVRPSPFPLRRLQLWYMKKNSVANAVAQSAARKP